MYLLPSYLGQCCLGLSFVAMPGVGNQGLPALLSELITSSYLLLRYSGVRGHTQEMKSVHTICTDRRGCDSECSS